MPESLDAILKDRFFHPGETTWEDVCKRVANTWGVDQHHAAALYQMMLNKRALPNTPAIANAGRDVQTGSACFVLPVNDSLTDGPASIMQTLKDAAAVHKSGGGTGFSFGRIRGRGTPVKSTGRGAPGAVNVLRLYSDSINRVTQAGMRPGANMGILPIDHPDILEFIKCKHKEGDIHNFNISVAVTDEFMMKVVSDTLDHHERFIWDAIVEGAWLNGEPGIFFIDVANRTAQHKEWIESTNPCGEVPLLPYEACVLGSVNLAQHIKNNTLDERMLAETVEVLVWTLDSIITKQDYPIPEIEKGQKRYRKIGVGVMGYADALCELGLKYGSDEAVAFLDRTMQYIQANAIAASVNLALAAGPYDGYEEGMPYRRNLCVGSQAPTGTISRLAECSFGIEPHFDVDSDGNYLSFVVGGKFTDHNPYYSDPFFKPASQVTLGEHIATLAAAQKHIDQGVSKTINCPYETTLGEVSDAFIDAWRSECKGITLLRENSRDDVVIGKAREGDCVGASCAF